MSQRSDSAGTTAATYVVVVVAAVLIGAMLAPFAPTLSSPQPDRVAVIALEGPVTADSVEALRTDLREVRRNESVEAVVLDVNSPGGSVAATESLYLAVNRTAAEMPVVASVNGVGASGAYWAMLPADRIYTTPGSLVGSVGVIASVPVGPTQVTGQLATGPDKPTGGTADDTRTRVETLHRLFLDTVYEHRGEALDLSREELAYAKVYAGARAVDNGVADRIGGINEAIAHAAGEAGLENYDVVRKEPPRRGIGILLASGDGENRSVVVEDDQFGFDGVETTQYYALYGSLENDSEVTVDE